MTYPVSLFFFTLWLVMVVCVFSPNSVGEWQAQRDIAYDKVVNEAYKDIDYGAHEAD